MRYLVLLLLLSACRTPCAADEKATPEQLRREQKAMLRGQGICLELGRPRLEVVDDRVVLSAVKDNVLGRRADIPVDGRYEPLAVRLAMYREHFKAVRADPWDPTLSVVVAEDLEASRVVTLLATATAAGFPRIYLSGKGGTAELVDLTCTPEVRTVDDESFLALEGQIWGGEKVRLAPSGRCISVRR